jgi:hypothetical protein
MNAVGDAQSPSWTRVALVGLFVGFLLNLTGWLGNNFVLGAMWRAVGDSVAPVAWRESPWKDVFSLVPDFFYGLAIAWLCIRLRPSSSSWVSPSLQAGIYVSLVGGITTYFAIANSGFIPWLLAFASFALVLGTKLPLALLAGWLLEPSHDRSKMQRIERSTALG